MELKKDKRKIAFVSTLKSEPWGGSEELWYLSASKAIEENHQIGIFVYDWNNLPHKLQQLKNKGAKIFKRPKQTSLLHRISLKICHQFSLFYPNFLNPYLDLIKFNPDSIVVTDGATYYTVNDVWLNKILTNHFEQRFIIVCQGNTLYHLPKSRNTAVNLFKKAQKIVFVADKNREDCFHQLGQKLENTMIIQNPINIQNIELLPMPSVTDNSIHFAMVGRLAIADKGQDMIIALMSQPFWKTADVFIHIYGAGNDKEYLNQLIKYYQVEDKVILEGFLDPISIYKKCHGLLLPSLLEGTSLSMLEAMALGRVCIITDVGGSSEWIIDGENGYLVEAPTIPLLGRKMRIAIENKENWSLLGKNAHINIFENLDRFPEKTLYKLINQDL